MEQSVKCFLESFGIDPEAANFVDTPHRFTKLFHEMFPNRDQAVDISTLFERKFPTRYRGIILIPSIVAMSMCPHHLLPVEYHIDVAYIPNQNEGMVIGLSKVVRLAKTLAARLVLQEDVTQDILDAFSPLNPDGVAVITKGFHGCIKCRGAKHDGPVIMSAMNGSFYDDPKTRQELFELLQMRGKNG